MAISSINFQKSKSNSVAETTREFEANYLLPTEHRKENEYYSCGSSEKELFKEELDKSTRLGGRIPKYENSIWEGVLNLNAKHTIKDVNIIGNHIADKFNLHYTRGALHRDEGHIDEKGKVQYNLHAHLNFMTYKDGKQNWRLQFINKKALSELQTEVAELLGMDRGELNSKSVRANHRHFREKAEEIKEQRAVSAVQEEKKVLKKENTSLKSQNTKLTNTKAQQKELLEALKLENKELQSKLSNREEHAQREALNTQLKAEIKTKDLTIADIQSKFKDLEEKLIPKLEKEIKHLTSLIEVKDIDIIDLNIQNKSLQAVKIDLTSKVTALEEKTAHSSNIDVEINTIVKDIFNENNVDTKKSYAPKGIVEWFTKKYHSLIKKINELTETNKAQTIEIAELKEKLKTIVPKQQKESLDIFESIQSEAKRNLATVRKSDSSILKTEKEETTTTKIRRER